MIDNGEELLRLIGDGDTLAVGMLYDRHGSLLFALALRILRDRIEAEDAVHDAFLNVFDQASVYSPNRGSVVAWLVMLVRNVSIDRLRRRSRSEGADFVTAPAELSAEETRPDAERLKCRRAVASLPGLERRTLEHAFFDGLTFAEIAMREELPVATIRTRAVRAIAGLCAFLGAEPGEDACGVIDG